MVRFRTGVPAMIVALFSSASTFVVADDLAAPQPIRAGSQQLDVERKGHASPFVADFDGDGLVDLLVGEHHGGRLRVYRNEGGSDSPVLTSYTIFGGGLRDGTVPQNNGFCPHMTDLDGDGNADLLTPSWYGEVRVFWGTGVGEFAPGTPLLDPTGKAFRLEWTTGVTTADWDDDGNPDVIVGTTGQGAEDGNVILLRGIDGPRDRFGSPEVLKAATKPIRLSGFVSPCATDWDGDGHVDLLCGCLDGSVVWFRNAGTTGRPALTASEQLVAAPDPKSLRGSRSHICVADWNADGRSDLLIGDFGARFEKELSEAEHERKQQHQADQQRTLVRWGRFFRTYRELRKKVGDGDEDAKRRLALIRIQLNRLSRAQRSHRLADQAIYAGPQYHGRVWVALRKRRP